MIKSEIKKKKSQRVQRGGLRRAMVCHRSPLACLAHPPSQVSWVRGTLESVT